MFCEIINRTPFYVNIVTASEQQTAPPDGRVFVRCDGGKLDVSLSYRMNSFRNEIGFENRSVEGFFRRLAARLDKNTAFQHIVVIDSDFTFSGVLDGELFTVVNLENDLTTQDRCRAPKLIRERGEATRKRFAPRKSDETVARYRKENRSACRKFLAVQLLTEGIVQFAVLVLLLLIFGDWSDLNTEEKFVWIGCGLFISACAFGVPIREYIRETKHNFIAVFCRNSSK